MTQYSGIPSISRYAKWLLNVPATEQEGFIRPIEFWGIALAVPPGDVPCGVAAASQ